MSQRNPSANLNEQSPLISASDTGHDDDIEADPLEGGIGVESPALESKSSFYLILLTLSIGGLQIVWSVEFSNGSPYLLSLGMSKALVAFVWLAGPLTGVLVQPYIGIVSDRSRISWGKRKPFMVAGTAGTVISSLLLAYAKDIIRVVGRWSIEDKYEGWWMGLTITLATILMWCLDFSINTVQAAIRAFIIDNAPAHQQESANAWASRLTGVGNVLGYVFGYLNLPKYFRFLGNTQFKVLCMVASIAISSTVLISCLAIKERNPQDEPPSPSDGQSTGFLSFFKQIFASIKRMTPTVRSVCKIQLFDWLGWFPFLYYITTYIGQLYVNPRLRPEMTDEEVEALWATATRVGTLALLIEAIITFAGNVLLPFIIEPTYTTDTVGKTNQASNSSLIGQSDLSMSLNLNHYLTKLQIPGLTLSRMWFYAQILHALCMFSTFFISTPTAGTIMVATVGLSWAVTLWAPFALISADVAQRDEERRLRVDRAGLNPNEHIPQARNRPMRDDSEAAEGLMAMTNTTPPAQSSTLISDQRDNNSDGSHTGVKNNDEEEGDVDIEADKLINTSSSSAHHLPSDEEQPDRAGIILGLHNVAVSAPQILATLLCSLIFKALQKPRREPNDVSVAWALRLSGIAALVAAWFTWRMKAGR